MISEESCDTEDWRYADVLLKKHFLLWSMLKTVVLLDIYVETDAVYFEDSLMNRKFKINQKYIFFVTFKCLYYYLNLIHPCWIKVLIY